MAFLAGFAVCNPLTDGIEYRLEHLVFVPVVMPFFFSSGRRFCHAPMEAVVRALENVVDWFH